MTTTYTGTDNNDVKFGSIGDDILSGLGGDDWFYGSYGNDELQGGLGNDSLSGGSGIDFLEGGGGYDLLTGGLDKDYFNLVDITTKGNYYLDAGYATIEDWEPSIDKIIVYGSPQQYNLRSGNGKGSSTLDTGIYYGNELIAVVQDNSNVNISRDFLFWGSSNSNSNSSSNTNINKMIDTFVAQSNRLSQEIDYQEGVLIGTLSPW